MRWSLVALCLLLHFRVDAGQAAEAKPRTVIQVWDTLKPAGAVLSPALAGETNWQAIPLDKTPAGFQADAVISNGRIALMVRQQDSAAEVFTLQASGVVSRL